MSKPRAVIAADEHRLAQLDAIAEQRELTAAEVDELEDLAGNADMRRRKFRSRLPEQIAAARTKLARLEAQARAIGVSYA